MNRKWPLLTGWLLALVLPCGAQPLTSMVFSNAAGLNLSGYPSNYNVSLAAAAADGNGTMVAVGAAGNALSWNGANWLSNSASTTAYNLTTVASSAGTYEAGGQNASTFFAVTGFSQFGQTGNAFANSAEVGGITATSAGRRVAVGKVVEASFSDNGSTWSAATIVSGGFLESFRGVTPMHSNEFELCGASGDIRRSTDNGVTWVQNRAFTPGAADLLGIAYDGTNGLVTVGSGGTILRSTDDGVTWTNITSPTATNLNAVTRAGTLANGGFIAVGDSGVILVSADNGVTWTKMPSPPGVNSLRGVAVGAQGSQVDGLALLVGDSGTVVVGGFVPPAPVNATGTSTECSGQMTLTLTVTKTNLAYVVVDWLDGLGNVLTNNSLTFVPTNTVPGTYTNFARARDTRTGLSSTNVPVSFTVNPLPTAVVSGSGIICAGFSTPITATLGGSAGPLWNVTWSDGTNQLNVGNPAVRMVSPATTTTYTVVAVSDVITGCTNVGTGGATVTVNPLPTAVVSGGGPICPGTSSQISAALDSSGGPWVLAWSDGTNQIALSSPAVRLVSPSITTIYTVTILTNITTGCTNVGTGAATVTVNPLPAAPVSLGDQANCAGVTNPPLMVSLGVNVTADWFDASSGGNLVTNKTARFVPTNHAVGTWNFFAQSSNTVTGCVNTNRTQVSLILQACTNALTVSAESSNKVVLTWFGNLELLSTTNITNPLPSWTVVSNPPPGGTNRWTNSVVAPPTNQYFRLFAPTN